MEKRYIRKKSLKSRILKTLFVVLAVSMIFSTVISYVYFEKILRKQVIEEEIAGLEQVASQLEFMVEDIQNFAAGIIADEDLQNVLNIKKTESAAFDKVKKENEMSDRLVFYNSLRTYIAGSFVILENGEKYCSTGPLSAEEYMEEKLKIKELQNYTGNKKEMFSLPYYGVDNWISKPVICFGSPMYNKFQFGEEQGILYLEIYLEYFLKQVEAYGENQNNICLMGNDNEVLYEGNKEGELSRIIKNQKNEIKEGTSKVEGNYFICNDVGNSGWKLYVMITPEYLWKRCRFVFIFFSLSFVISISAILLTTSRLMEQIIRPVTVLSRRMEKTHYNKLRVQEMVHTGDEIEILYQCYNDMVEEIQRGIEQQRIYEKRTKDMEFDIMLSQINPHYLYNVLNTVVYLSAAGKNKEVVKITNALIFSLQDTMRLGEKNIETTVEKELMLTQCYLDIQKYRYPDVFEAVIECGENLKECLVPKTIIQPLVENGILHGILPLEEPGIIYIRIYKKEDFLCIEVEDNGEGISKERLEAFEQGEELIYEKNGRKHIGISNVRDRISYLYGEPYGMWITRLPERGTKVTLHLPYKI